MTTPRIAQHQRRFGLTLHGLVRLLQACPALGSFSILIDTPTFTYIPEGMDVSYPPRKFWGVNPIDSPLEVDMLAGMVDVFVAIKLSPTPSIPCPRYRMEEAVVAEFG